MNTEEYYMLSIMLSYERKGIEERRPLLAMKRLLENTKLPSAMVLGSTLQVHRYYRILELMDDC